MINEKNNLYTIKIKNDSLNNYNVTFQNNLLSLDDLDDYYCDKANIGDEFEVLPGVFYRKQLKLKKICKLQEYNGEGRVIIYIFKLLFKCIYLSLYSKQKALITINIQNKRDYFNIQQTFYEKKEKYKSYITSYTRENIWISPNKLPYPNTMGKGGMRCDIWCMFQSIGLLDCSGNNVPYHVFSVKELLEETSHDTKLLELCAHSKHCGGIIKKFKDGTYKAKFDGGEGDDDITISYKNGSYSLYGGKHRVCIAKRFNISTIPVVVDVGTENKDSFREKDDCFVPWVEKYNCEQIMKECYDRFYAIGLNNSDVHKLLATVENHGDLIRFIQQTTNKTISEIFHESL